MSRVAALTERARDGHRIVAATAYDYWSAGILADSSLDFLLVGDSVAMVVYGHPTTRVATLEMMAAHTAAVRRGAPAKIIVADLPFPLMQGTPDEAAEGAAVLVAAGADAVKVEALPGYQGVVEAIRAQGIAVMGHAGLLPQEVLDRDGFRVRGRGDEAAEVRHAARTLEAAGCFALVLECVPDTLSRAVTAAAGIPTIGIGAGSGTDGQVLVLQDLAGFNPGFRPRFVRRFGDGAALLRQAVEDYAGAVRQGRFPDSEESYE